MVLVSCGVCVCVCAPSLLSVSVFWVPAECLRSLTQPHPLTLPFLTMLGMTCVYVCAEDGLFTLSWEGVGLSQPWVSLALKVWFCLPARPCTLWRGVLNDVWRCVLLPALPLSGSLSLHLRERTL